MKNLQLPSLQEVTTKSMIFWLEYSKNESLAARAAAITAILNSLNNNPYGHIFDAEDLCFNEEQEGTYKVFAFMALNDKYILHIDEDTYDGLCRIRIYHTYKVIINF